MDELALARLRDDLDAAGYRSDAVRALLGADADAARARGILAPARVALAARETSALASLVRLFLLGEPLDAATVELGLPSLGNSGALELGLVEAEPLGFRAAVALNPVLLPEAQAPREWWLLSDLDDQLRRGPARPDHVMGLGAATRSLLALAPLGGDASPEPRAALDLGTGCGIVSLVLADAGVPRVVASDISERALRFARANAQLNGLGERIEFVQGDLYEAVAGERFDLILSNPPFVITPRGDAGVERYEYRDGGMVGDELAARVVREAPALLAEGGTLLCLANWETPWGGDGLDRVRDWICDAGAAAGCGVDAWVIERDRIEPTRYAEIWARDGGARPGEPGFDRLVVSWLGDFAARRVVSIGLGSIRLRRGERATHGVADSIRTEQAPGVFAQDRPGLALQRAFDAGRAAERMDDDEVLDTRWLRSPRTYEEREYEPGSEDPRAISLVVNSPIGRRIGADPLLAAALGACDGELSLRQLADALATLLEVDPAGCATELAAGMRELAWLGMAAPSRLRSAQQSPPLDG